MQHDSLQCSSCPASTGTPGWCLHRGLGSPGQDLHLQHPSYASSAKKIIENITFWGSLFFFLATAFINPSWLDMGGVVPSSWIPACAGPQPGGCVSLLTLTRCNCFVKVSKAIATQKPL